MLRGCALGMMLNGCYITVSGRHETTPTINVSTAL
jgi:hypothetical protein